MAMHTVSYSGPRNVAIPPAAPGTLGLRAYLTVGHERRFAQKYRSPSRSEAPVEYELGKAASG